MATANFRGGLILPGFELMRQSLTRNTAQLQDQPGRLRRAAAQYRGCHRQRLPRRPARRRRAHAPPAWRRCPMPLCMVSGGAAQPLADRLDLP
ncbi:MAG: type III pantothenate kinase [Comamonadaceae bacterium]|nr:type III pantothenate kinase [Comamonadaceae bacterium]